MKFIALIFIPLFFISCKSEPTTKETKQEFLNEPESKDEKVIESDLSNIKKPLQTEVIENHQKITQKYGKQLDFCSCIQFHDSLNNAAQKDLSDKQIEKLLNRWEQMEVKCKELVNTEHRTPEERFAHERKVQKCLN